MFLLSSAHLVLPLSLPFSLMHQLSHQFGLSPLQFLFVITSAFIYTLLISASQILNFSLVQCVPCTVFIFSFLSSIYCCLIVRLSISLSFLCFKHLFVLLAASYGFLTILRLSVSVCFFPSLPLFLSKSASLTVYLLLSFLYLPRLSLTSFPAHPLNFLSICLQFLQLSNRHPTAVAFRLVDKTIFYFIRNKVGEPLDTQSKLNHYGASLETHTMTCSCIRYTLFLYVYFALRCTTWQRSGELFSCHHLP